MKIPELHLRTEPVLYSLHQLIMREVVDKNQLQICEAALFDPRCKAAVAARSHHHDFPGGLILHVSEVMKYSLALCETMGGLARKEIIIPAVLFHDYGKIFDYEWAEVETDEGISTEIIYTSHLKLIGHVARGYEMWMKVAPDGDAYSEEEIEQVGHCLLSHHGRKEWGSPVEPQTAEALILHSADMLSSHYPAHTDKSKDNG